MRTLLMAGLLSASVTTAFADREAMDLTKLAMESVTVDTAKKNVDGSVTFKKISVSRGDEVYEIDGTLTTYSAVCKMLGYEDSLTGEDLNLKEFIAYSHLVVLNNQGQYEKTIKNNLKISKVTCFNSAEIKPAIDFDRKTNPDGSSTISKITYLRGDLVYDVEAGSFDSACKLVGFDASLTGGELNNRVFTTYRPMVRIDTQGRYEKTISNNLIFQKVTCYSGREPEFIVLVDGVRYRRQ